MKRLSPIDTVGIGGSGELKERGAGSSAERQPAPTAEPPQGPVKHERCALPVDPDPRRTAFYAIVADSEESLLYVCEAPIEIVPFRDTELVHFAYLPDAETTEEILVTMTDDTCFDVTHPFRLLEPGTPVIVVGLDLGVAIAAEIIASVSEEPRYRALLMRHQKSRQWYPTPVGSKLVHRGT